MQKKKSTNYFGKEQEDALKEYLVTTDQKEKNRIFELYLYHSFDKLCENIINTFGFYSTGYDYDILKADTLSFLVEKIHKFDPSKNTKAFSYFGTIAKRYLIQITRKKASKFKLYEDYNETELEDRNLKKNQLEKIDFISLLSQEILLETKKEKHRNDIGYLKYLEALYVILQKYNTIDFLEKKYIRVYIKQLSGLNEKQIASYQTKAKKELLEILYQKYNDGTL